MDSLDNPYAPPTAQIAVDVLPQAAPTFFAVSRLKLVVLSLCTLGLYDLYWFYNNWHRIKARQEPTILPVWRSVFAVLFCYPCFARIRAAGVERGITPAPAAGWLAVGWIVTTISSRIPTHFWLITFASCVFMLPIQAYANRINAVDAPTHDPNIRFTPWNWVGVVVGCIWLTLLLVGELLPGK